MTRSHASSRRFNLVIPQEDSLKWNLFGQPRNDGKIWLSEYHPKQ